MGSSSQVIPPPPAGFTFDAPPAARSAARSPAVPPPPVGFTFDAPPRNGAGEAASGLLEGAKDVGKGAVQSILHPLDAISAVWKGMQYEADRTAQSLNKQDYLGAVQHLAGIFPVLGPALDSVVDAIGDPTVDDHEMGKRVGRALTMVVAPDVIKKGIEAAPAIGTALKGAAKGGFDAATESAHFRGLDIPGGNVMAGAVGGGAAARALGLPGELGAVVGGSAPILKGAFTGAKAALAARTAAQTPVIVPPAPAPFEPKALLPAGPIVTEAPADTSFVRSVPLEEINPQMAAQSATAPPAPTVDGVPVAALDELAAKTGFKDFASAPPQAQPLLLNQAKAIIASQARPPVAPVETPAPATPAPEPPATPAPPTALSKAELAKQALAEEMLKSGTATKEMLVPPPDTPTEVVTAAGKKALAKTMRDLPPGAPKAMADASYAADQNPELAGAVYEAAGRASKAQNLSQMLHDEGLTSRTVAKWTPEQWAQAVDDRGMPHVFSAESRGEVIQMLKNLEKKVPKK